MDKKKYIWVFAILIFIIGGGIFAWQYFGAPKNETANWQTYKNENFGFEIKYPKEWFAEWSPIVQGLEATKTLQLGELFKQEIDGERREVRKIGMSVRIFEAGSGYVWPKDVGDLSIEEFIAKSFLPEQLEFTEGESLEPIVFGAEDYEGLSLKLYKEVGVPSLITRVYIKRGDVIYELESETSSLSTMNLPTKYDYQETYRKILSTFRFIEIDETIDWETYKNDKYGFEIKYPSFLEGGEPGCRISEVEDTIFIGPVSLMFFDSQGLTLDEWINGEVAKTEQDTKEMQESARQAGNANWQEFGSKLLSREEIFIDGERAVKLSYQFIGAGFDLPISISIKKGDRIYDFRTNDANLVQEGCAAKFGKKPSEIMELMLSTFKFVK